MADFDAGSIEGRLDLDTSAFVRGLKEAKAQAAEFEATSSTTSTAGVNVNVDDGDATAKIAKTEAALERLDHKKAEPKIEIETAKSTAAIMALDAAINKVAGSYAKNSAGGLSVGSGHGMAMLLGLAASLAPALGPATAGLGLFGAAGGAAFGGMAISMALWGKLAAGIFGQIEKADKAGKTLTGTMGRLQGDLKGLQKAWSDLQTKAGPGIAGAIEPTFHTLQQVLPKLLPLVNAISTGVGGALRPIDNLLKSGQFEKFIHLLGDNAVKDLPQLGHALANILSGLMGVFTALNPVIQAALPVVVGMTKEFRSWAQTGAGDFVGRIFDEVQKYGPETIQLLHNVFTVLGNIGAGLAPLVGPALSFLVALTGALGKIDLAPLASGVGKVLTALQPFLAVIAELVNTLLPPLGILLGTLADSFIGPLGKSLATELAPALSAIAGLLQSLAAPLGLFIASIADLVNPTGVGLLVSLITGLVPVLNSLLPSLLNLATAIEGVVDNFLTLVGPAVIPALVTSLKGIAAVVAPVLNFFAWFIAHKAVGDTLLGLAVGLKAVKLAMAGWAIFGAILEGVAAGILGITVAEDASKASVIANNAVLLVTKGIMLAVRGATLLWAGAQWLLNAAMDANPIGLIVLAIAALVVGVIEAYKHVGWFRSAINDVWDAMKVAGAWIAGVFVAIWHGLGDAFDFVKHHLELFMLLLGPLGAAIDLVIEIVKHWRQILGIITAAWDAVIGFIRGLPGKIIAAFSGAGNWLNSHGRAIITGLWNGIKSVWSDVTGWLGNIDSKILSAIGNLGSILWNAGSAIMDGLLNGIKAGFEKVKNFVSGIGSWISAHKGPIDYDKTLLTKHGEAIMEGLNRGLTHGFGDVQNNVQAMGGNISKAIEDGIGTVVGKAQVDISTTRAGYAAELQAQSQSDALDRLTAALKTLDQKSLSQEDQDALTSALSQAFTAAGVAQARTIITAVKKQ